MTSRLFARVLPASARRIAANAAPRITRRRMATSHGDSAGSDTPWLIGSALVFGPLIVYFAIPSKSDSAHSEHHDAKDESSHANEKGTEPTTEKEQEFVSDDEGNKVPAEEVASSVSKAFKTDSPQDALASEADNKDDQSAATRTEAAEQEEETEASKPEKSETKSE